jgi:hypothetical protein
MDWSTAECAGYMGVTRETVSRWESGAIPIGDTADRLVRGLVALKAAAPVPLDVFRDVTGPATPQRLTAHFTEAAGWRTELAPAPDRAVARPKAGRPRAATSRGARGKHTEAKSARGSRVSR